MRAAFLEPVNDHAGLRERKGQEGADGGERNEAVSNSTEEHKKKASQNGQNGNSVVINEAAATIRKGVR